MVQETAAKQSGSKTTWIVRIILFAVLIVAIVTLLLWRGALNEYRRGVELYEEGEFQEACDVFDAVANRPLAAFRISRMARKARGLCLAELASEKALEAETATEYEEAILMLKEAEELSGPSKEIARRINEYTEYLDSARRREEEAAAAEAARGIKTPEAPEPVTK